MCATRLQVVRNKRTFDGGQPVSNKILLSISDSEYQKISPKLGFVTLHQHLVLHEAREKQKYAYFLNRGLASIVVATRDGKGVEAGVVACEGVVGTALAVGLDRSPLRVIMQIEGDGFRIDASDLQDAVRQAPGLAFRMTRYAVLQGMQVAQTAACNRLHEITQRLARWLLMAHDRISNNFLPLTHDFLAVMLGSDRPSVSLATAALRRRKAIRSRRGAVEVINRAKLQASACECYRVIHDLTRQLGLKVD